MRDMLRQMGPTGSRIWSPPSRCIAPARWPASPIIAGASTARHGRRRIRSCHDILAETYGIMVYQEQVMQIAQRMAGYSPGRRRSAAPRDGQEDPRRDGGAARDLHRRRHGARHRPGEGRRSLRADGEVRRLRLQQMPRRAVRAARLPDRLAEGEPSGGVHRRLHEPRPRQHRPAGGVAAGGRAGVIAHAAAGHQPLRRRFHRRTAGRRHARDPLRAGRGEEGRHGRDAGGGRRARRPPVRRSRRFRRARRSAAAQQDAAGEPGDAGAFDAAGTPIARVCSPAPKRSCAARRPRPRKPPAARSACSAAPARSGAAAPAGHARLAA